MNTWSTVIAHLASTPGGADAQASAQANAHSLVKKEYCTVRKQFDQSEQQLKALEIAYIDAKLALQALERQTKLIELDTQTALAQQESQKALVLAAQIAQLHVNVLSNRHEVANFESTLNELKGTLSHNRYNLFRLAQQLDTLSATSQLQQAQSQLAQDKGIRTALHSIAVLNARSAANENTPSSPTPSHDNSQIESAEQILKRLRPVK